MTDPVKTPWFAQKTYGYGAGLPIAWQGWALLGGYFSLLAALGWMNDLPGDAPKITASGLFIAATATLIVVVKNRTRGGWRWRWGGE